ncbi:alpha-1,3-mannosyl-glycoprotein 4-beta-N-acetylglucosaminyltransferase C-like [Anneissia japonica]|uniref:alpha-1,3-mannosyl-glycoprotein 4-beta-N-acetylglucosaminyltransferase C-like n=1 Tax=Anneissia japonica TaxID=1529436 RepID=UPI001425B55C|nr:alpha-1,3-mannosyl-glycoprotein 4-beta-N-acetylglucosaminyltransferase C-like [Anneissia japonica]
MPAGRRWNQILVMLLVMMFLFNTWLIRTVNWMSKQPCFSESSKIPNDDIFRDSQVKWQARMLPNVKGEHLNSEGFLTIGIPTIHREKGFYILETLQSIIDNTSEEDKKMIIIVVFTADFNATYNQEVSQQIGKRFYNFVDSGLIRVIQAPNGYYPTFQNLKHNYGDSEKRVIWRTKQVLDYAFLYQYCYNLTDYYMQLEDDVRASPKFVQSIQEYIVLNMNENWSTLEFSELGFIGKVFRSTDLKRFMDFVLIFFQDQPIDYLLKYFNVLNGQKKTLLRVPSLFQHVGTFSSLHEKEQPLKDRFFEENGRTHFADNPPAEVYSSISTFSMYAPNLAYTNDPGYFWGRVPRVGDVILVIFHEAVRLKRVVFETGSSGHPHDILYSALLTAGRQVLKFNENSPPTCQDEVELAVFNNGKIDVQDIDDGIKSDVACLKVLITGSQPNWVLLREIDVWVKK